ncbi:LLM class F420-dependent oxidoreductase [Peterkaempfera bronchialis]|uniref:LLM class F420-dependent oxidoreductase n=1 Tax=Peterkaempfera bronchialis TaxID=2126346 RepID=UPI003C2EE56A
MKFTLEYPTERSGHDTAFHDPATMTRFVRAAEEAGFDAICLSEHPAPSRKWVEHGGHTTFDAPVVLAHWAARTERIRMMTHLTVLPYRNPLLAAKTLTTLDRMTGGRLTVVAGAGYLRSEFAALGVDFEERNALFDEAAEVLTRVWSGAPLTFEGRHFTAREQMVRPGPVQPELPLWIGGNSRLARRRVVRFGQGWAPMFTGGEVQTATTRTAEIRTIEELAERVEELREQFEQAGRDPRSLQVQISLPGDPGDAPAQRRAQVERLAAAGVTWSLVHVPGDSLEHALDAVGRFGRDVAAATR